MKTRYIYALIALCLAFASCKDDSADNPAFGEKEIPYIYTNRPATIVAKVGEAIEFPMQVSPSDGSVAVKWTLNGEVIATSTLLQYTVNTAGTYILRFEATRNGIINYREYTLTVSP